LKLSWLERLVEIRITAAAAGQGQTEKENPGRSLHRALSSIKVDNRRDEPLCSSRILTGGLRPVKQTDVYRQMIAARLSSS